MKQGSTKNTASPGSVLKCQTQNSTNHVAHYDRLEDQNSSWQGRVSNFILFQGYLFIFIILTQQSL